MTTKRKLAVLRLRRQEVEDAPTGVEALLVGQLPWKPPSVHLAGTDHNTPACHAVDHKHALDQTLRRQLTMSDKGSR